MSCDRIGINIVLEDASACSLRCNYHPIYTIPYGITGTNEGSYLEYTFTNNDYSTIYNGSSYRASTMRLYQPSLHTYDGEELPAELVIQHTMESSNKELNVCIPIESGGPRTNNVGKLIAMTFEYANSQGSDTIINLPNFDISSIIPRKPFFSYTGTNTSGDCGSVADFIVFGDSASIKISRDIMTALQNGITDSSANIAEGLPYYYNENGPTLTTSGEIYIDCQPISSSDETTPYYTKGAVETVSLRKLFKNMFKNMFKNKILVASGVIIALLLIILILARLFQ